MSNLPRSDDRNGDPPEAILAFSIVRAGRAGVRRCESEVLRPLGLSLSGYEVLKVLWLLGPHEPRELARYQGVSVPSITSLLNTLERRGLIVRKRSAVDGRLVDAYITGNGIQLAREAQHGINQVTATAASALSLEGQKTMQDYLDRYLSAIGEVWEVEGRRELAQRLAVAATGNAPTSASQAAAMRSTDPMDTRPVDTPPTASSVT